MEEELEGAKDGFGEACSEGHRLLATGQLDALLRVEDDGHVRLPGCVRARRRIG